MPAIKIYDEIWVIKQAKWDHSQGYGDKSVCVGEEDLAYMCQNEPKNAAAFAKKQETGRSWSHNPNKAGTVYKNEPLEGFRLGKSVSRWSTSNKLFRLEDPRGFTVEISTGNLEMLMRDVTIVKGVIQGKCVWGRETTNILLSVDSEPFRNAVSMDDESLKNAPKFKDLKIGDKVTLRKGAVVTYIGTFDIEVEYEKWSTQAKHSWGAFAGRPASSSYKTWDEKDPTAKFETLRVSTGPTKFYKQHHDDIKKNSFTPLHNPNVARLIESNSDFGVPSIEDVWHIWPERNIKKLENEWVKQKSITKVTKID